MIWVGKMAAIPGKIARSMGRFAAFVERYIPRQLWLVIVFLVYSFVAFRQGPNIALIADSVAFVAFIGLIVLAISKTSNRFIRRLGLGLVTVAMVIVFVGNKAFSRFFGEWVNPDILRDWRLGPSIFWHILKWLRPWDWLVGIILPFIMLMVCSDRPYKGSIIRAGFVSALALAISVPIHGGLRDVEFDPRQHDVMMMLVRGWFGGWANGQTGRLEPQLLACPLGYRTSLDPKYPLIKVPDPCVPFDALLDIDPNRRPNIVLVVLESIRAYEMGAYGSRPSYTPNLDAIASDGLIVKNFYATGYQTVRGEFALLASLHDIYCGASVYVLRPNIQIQTLPMILKDHGYSTTWVHSLKRTFHNANAFLAPHGIDQMYDRTGMPHFSKVNFGPSDEDLFDYALQIMDQQRQPFFIEILTLSNHYPFDGPYSTADQTPPIEDPDPIYRNFCKGTFYADYAIGRFMEKVRSKPYFDQTLFIFTSDHGVWVFPKGKPLHTIQRQEIFSRIPLIFYGPAYIRPGVLDVVGSQLDVAPTILHMLGIRQRNAFTGNSLLEDVPKESRFALTLHTYGWNLRVGDMRIYNVGEEFQRSFTTHAPGRLRRAKASSYTMVQTTADLLFDPLPVKQDPFGPPVTSDWVRRVREHLVALNNLKLQDRVYRP